MVFDSSTSELMVTESFPSGDRGLETVWEHHLQHLSTAYNIEGKEWVQATGQHTDKYPQL